MYDGNDYWIDTLTQSYNTKLIMIYDYDFPKHPSYWKKVAELSLTRLELLRGGDGLILRYRRFCGLRDQEKTARVPTNAAKQRNAADI